MMEDCDSSHLGKVTNCQIGCFISYGELSIISLVFSSSVIVESIAGKENVYIRDCSAGEEAKCEKIDNGNSVGANDPFKENMLY